MLEIIHPRPVFTRREDGSPTYARGAKWPAWALLALPFIIVMVPLYRVVRHRVRWASCMLTVLVFEAMMIPVEHNSILRGHWVYNQNRILGPLFWSIPIEEPLIYYFLPPILIIMIFELVTGFVSGALRWGHLTDLPRRFHPVAELRSLRG